MKNNNGKIFNVPARKAGKTALTAKQIAERERALHAELKRQMFLLLRELGIKPAGRTLAAIMSEARARARLVSKAGEHMASHAAMVDGALDALKFGKPDDIARAKGLLERAGKQLELAANTAKTIST